jgi:hypothetical protein
VPVSKAAEEQAEAEAAAADMGLSPEPAATKGGESESATAAGGLSPPAAAASSTGGVVTVTEGPKTSTLPFITERMQE